MQAPSYVRQIQAGAPTDELNRPVLYQLAELREMSESNKRGAGRPVWLDPPAPLARCPDVSPGRYVIRYGVQPGEDFEELDRTTIVLMLPHARPLGATPEPARTREPDPPDTDPLTMAVRSMADLAADEKEHKRSVLLDQRLEMKELREQLADERAHNLKLQERIAGLIEGNMKLAELVSNKLVQVAEMINALPREAGEAPYIGVIRELSKMVEHVAPGINATLGGLGKSGQPLLPAGKSAPVYLAEGLLMILNQEAHQKALQAEPMKPHLKHQVLPGVYLLAELEPAQEALRGLGLPLPVEVQRLKVEEPARPEAAAPAPAPAEPDPGNTHAGAHPTPAAPAPAPAALVKTTPRAKVARPTPTGKALVGQTEKGGVWVEQDEPEERKPEASP